MKLLLALLLTSNLYASTRVSWDEPLTYDSVTKHTIAYGVEGALNLTQEVAMPNLFYIFEDSNFSTNNNYCFHVLSTNGIGDSLFSETKCKIIVVNVPVAPTGLGLE